MTLQQHMAALTAKNPRLESEGNITLPAANVLRMVRAAYRAGLAEGMAGDRGSVSALKELRKMMGMD